MSKKYTVLQPIISIGCYYQSRCQLQEREGRRLMQIIYSPGVFLSLICSCHYQARLTRHTGEGVHETTRPIVDPLDPSTMTY